MAQLGIELIPAYSPEARGRSEPMFGTLQRRLPQELRVAGIAGIEAANRFLAEVYLPRHNACFARIPEDAGAAFVPFAGNIEEILCIQEERVVGNDNTVRYKNRTLQIPAERHRHHDVKATVRGTSTLTVAWLSSTPPTELTSAAPIGKRREPFGAATACGFMDTATALPTCPTTTTEVVNSSGI